MEAVRSFETLANFSQITRFHISEDISYIVIVKSKGKVKAIHVTSSGGP
jgi:hypothetical protein